MSGSSINSLSHFQSHRYALMLLVFDPKKLEAGGGFYICGTIFVSLLFSLGFPLHLEMKLFSNETRNQNILNIGAFLPCLGASLKFTMYVLNFGKVRRMENLLRLLDRRVSGHKQKSIYAQVRTSCLGIASLLFFTQEPMVRAYNLCYSLAMILQIFPCCYFGTESQFWFGRLHYAAFSCNWLIQGRSFKKKLMLFVERSLKSCTAMAGGMVSISVGTFFATLKFAYSLFMIILRMD